MDDSETDATCTCNIACFYISFVAHAIVLFGTMVYLFYTRSYIIASLYLAAFIFSIVAVILKRRRLSNIFAWIWAVTPPSLILVAIISTGIEMSSFAHNVSQINHNPIEWHLFWCLIQFSIVTGLSILIGAFWYFIHDDFSRPVPITLAVMHPLGIFLIAMISINILFDVNVTHSSLECGKDCEKAFIITHMANTSFAANWGFELGANGIEMDIHFENGDLYAYHGFPSDCLVGSGVMGSPYNICKSNPNVYGDKEKVSGT